MSSRSSRNIASRSLAATLIIIVTAAVAVSILKRGDLGTTTALLCSSSQPTAAAVDGAQQALLRDLNDAKKKAKTCAKELENVGEARAEAEERAARYQEEAAKASDLCPKATAGASTPDELARSIFQADAQVLESTLSTYEALLEGTWDRQLAAQPEEGILMVAGAKKYLINAFVSLWAVRRHWNSTLPVAIM